MGEKNRARIASNYKKDYTYPVCIIKSTAVGY